jgi:hypothetical protein
VIQHVEELSAEDQLHTISDEIGSLLKRQIEIG